MMTCAKVKYKLQAITKREFPIVIKSMLFDKAPNKQPITTIRLLIISNYFLPRISVINSTIKFPNPVNINNKDS